MMPQSIYLPQDPRWAMLGQAVGGTTQFIYQLALNKIAHNMQMDNIEAQSKLISARKSAEMKEKHGYDVKLAEKKASLKQKTDKGLQKKTRNRLVGNVLQQQEYNFNPSTGEENQLGPWVDVADYSKRNMGPKWQHKRRVYRAPDGRVMAQEFDYNPDIPKRVNVGPPYEIPKTFDV